MVHELIIFLTTEKTYGEMIGGYIDQLTGEQPTDDFVYYFGILFGLAFLFGAIYLFKDSASEKLKASSIKKGEKNHYTADNSKELILQVLRGMGCPIISKELPIRFKYSGEEFMADPFHPSFVLIWEHLGCINLTESEEDAQLLKQAVNEMNKEHFFPSFVYEEDEEENELNVYGYITTVFRKEIPGLENLFSSYLDSIAKAKREIVDKFHLIKKEKEKQKRVVVKGSSAYSEKEN